MCSFLIKLRKKIVVKSPLFISILQRTLVVVLRLRLWRHVTMLIPLTKSTVLWRHLCICTVTLRRWAKFWRVKELFVLGIVTSTLKSDPPWGRRGFKSRITSSVSPACRKRRLNGAMCRNHRNYKKVVPCWCLDGHVKEPYEMSMALGARPYVQLLLQSACTSMCRHMNDWNIVDCVVKQPSQLNST